jgi:hypothetical protein
LCIDSKQRLSFLPISFCFFMDIKIDYILFTICIALLIDVFRKICFMQQKL